jgi:hypothetical protein
MPFHPPLTVADVLGREALPAAIQQADPVGTVLRSLPGPVHDLVTGRVTETLDEQLAHIDLGEMAVEAWIRIAELHAAAQRTRADPTAREDVTLLDHEVIAEHHLAIAIWLDGQLTATLDLDVYLTLTVVGVTAEVRGGQLVGLRSGEVTASGRLAWKEHDLLKSPVVTLRAGTAIRLGTGVPLVRNGAAPRSRWNGGQPVS